MKKIKLFILFLILILSFTGCSSLKLQNEKGAILEFSGKEGMPAPKETKNYKISFLGPVMNDGKWRWGFGFDIKDENIQLEYIKVELIIPNNSILMVEDNKSMNNNKNNFKWIENNKTNSRSRITKIIFNEKQSYSWAGQTAEREMSDEMLKSMKKSKYLYLAKFTIKGKGMEPEIIYQPSILPIDLGLVHTKKFMFFELY